MMDNQHSGRLPNLLNARGQALVILVALVVLTGGSFAAGYMVATAGVGRPAADMKVFWEAWNLTDAEFYYAKPDEKDRVYGAIQGMLAAYKDPYTLFVPPDTAAANNQVMEGETGGIGALVAVSKNGELLISEAMIGKPAALAGVQTGDVILAVDGKSVDGMTLTDAVKLIRGPIGTQVKLTLRRSGVDAPFLISVQRDQINIYGKMLPGNIAYVSLALFNKTAPTELKAEISQLLKDNPRVLILDLRGNPGGYLEEAVSVADLFLSEGLVATERTTAGISQQYNARTGDIAEQIPLLVLVDQGSASAAEIVAGALQDRHRALLVGQNTYGKGSVQTLHTLSDGSQLRITHGAWYTPNNTPLQHDGERIGLTPDIPVTLPENPEPGVDPTLNAAVEYARSHF
jgi:carboxyl-terminal processing protease